MEITSFIPKPFIRASGLQCFAAFEYVPDAIFFVLYSWHKNQRFLLFHRTPTNNFVFFSFSFFFPPPLGRGTVNTVKFCSTGNDMSMKSLTIFFVLRFTDTIIPPSLPFTAILFTIAIYVLVCGFCVVVVSRTPSISCTVIYRSLVLHTR